MRLPTSVLRRLLADDQPVALAVDLQDLDRDALADQSLEGARVGASDLAGRKEAPQAQDVDDEPALVLLPHVSVDDRPVGLLLSSHQPGGLRPRAAQAEDDVALLVLGLQDVDLDLVARLEAGGVEVSAHAELLARDDTLSLGSDVDQYLVRVDSHDDPIHDVPVVGGLEGLLVVMEVVLHGHRCRRILVGPLLVFGQDGTRISSQNTNPLEIIGVVLVVKTASAKTSVNCTAQKIANQGRVWSRRGCRSISFRQLWRRSRRGCQASGK